MGVLKSVRGEKQTQYQLRNANIRRLIGDGDEGQDDIDSKLSEAIQQQVKSSPLDRHAFFEHDGKPILSPITFRDEKGFFGSEQNISDGSGLIKLQNNSRYTVSVVVGSEAQGLNSVADSLRLLYEAETFSNPDFRSGAGGYEVFDRFDSDFSDPEAFRAALDAQ